MISTYEALRIKYPGIILIQYEVLLNNFDGGINDDATSLGISNMLTNIGISQQDLLSYKTDSSIIDEYTKRQLQIKNRFIYDELDDIDKKSIRALREGDDVKIKFWDQAAEAARAKLVK